MTTLEQRIAEVIHRYINDGSGASWLTAEDIARAVVAVLPTGDVSDEQIRKTVDDADREWFALISPETDEEIGSRLAYIARAVRELFTADTAEAALAEKDAHHAARIAGYADQLRIANEVVDELVVERDAALAEVERLTAERDRAVREALENAARKIEQEHRWPHGGTARIVRSLIEGGE